MPKTHETPQKKQELHIDNFFCIVHKMGRAEDPQNFLLMHAAGANVSVQIASVIASGLIITLVEKLL